MRVHSWKDWFLDLLLAVLVISSIFLSLQVWYPSEPSLAPASTGPSIQPQPPASEKEMPDIFRPEMILFRQKENLIAPIHPGSLAYNQVWPHIKGILTGLPSTSGAFQVDQVPERLLESEWVELRLPTPLMLSQWADLWRWNSPTLRNGSMRIDRITFYLGEPGAIYLSGPVGSILYLADLTQDRTAQFQQLMKDQDPALYVKHRPLALEGTIARIPPNLLVPDTDTMPVAHMRITAPDERIEEARYFPDLSVVRQIDEQGGRSLTDGQRLLRFTTAGLLEYRTADPSSPSSAPDMERALALAQEWVGSRGGWPQEILLRRYTQQPGRAKLEFDFRSGGPFPVESLGPAVQVHVSSHRVVYFSRYPSFVEMRFPREVQPVISPEAAITWAADQVSLLLIESVRSMHLAFVAKPDPEGREGRWTLEPAWVIRAGEARVYVYAGMGQEKVPPHLVR
ncbi:MAG: two-component system activity regulator YycH [Bacillota bacterium]